PDQTSSENPQGGAPAPEQAPPSGPGAPASPTPEVTAPPPSQTVTAEAAKPENNPAPARPAPSPSTSPRLPTPADRRAEPVPQPKPAPPGTYETIRSTRALEQPFESAPVVDPIPPRTRLTVIGSDGAWLVVRSRTRNRTVYVKRDDATLLSAGQAQ